MKRTLLHQVRENSNSSFFNSVIHELKNPLTAIRGFTLILMEERAAERKNKSEIQD